MVPVGRDAAIQSLIESIRRDMKRRVPNVDPNGPGAHARVLMLLSDPGESGALASGYLSPLRNSDPTANNQRRLMREAGLSPAVCVFWNGIPYDLEQGKANASDKRRGAGYLQRLRSTLQELRVIVADGGMT